jgi:hypothetical protein
LIGDGERLRRRSNLLVRWLDSETPIKEKAAVSVEYWPVMSEEDLEDFIRWSPIAEPAHAQTVPL